MDLADELQQLGLPANSIFRKCRKWIFRKTVKGKRLWESFDSPEEALEAARDLATPRIWILNYPDGSQTFHATPPSFAEGEKLEFATLRP